MAEDQTLSLQANLLPTSVGAEDRSKDFVIAEVIALRHEITAWEVEQHTFFRHIFIASTAVASWIIYAVENLGFLAVLISWAPYAIARFGHTHMGALGFNISRMGEYIRLRESEHFGGQGWETFIVESRKAGRSGVSSHHTANRQLLFLRRFYILFALSTCALVLASQPDLVSWLDAIRLRLEV